MDLLSVLCYNNGSPEKKLQGIICDKLIEQDEVKISEYIYI